MKMTVNVTLLTEVFHLFVLSFSLFAAGRERNFQRQRQPQIDCKTQRTKRQKTFVSRVLYVDFVMRIEGGKFCTYKLWTFKEQYAFIDYSPSWTYETYETD